MFMRQASPPNAGSGKIGLEHGFNALTILNPSCDRTALLVVDAHLLAREALDYIDFALGAAPHLQVAPAGQPILINMLAHENFRELDKALTDEEVGPGSTAVPAPIANVSVQRPLVFTERDASDALSPAGHKLPRSRNMAWFWGELVGLILIGLAVLPPLDQLTGTDYVAEAMQALGPHGRIQLAMRDVFAAHGISTASVPASPMLMAPPLVAPAGPTPIVSGPVILVPVDPTPDSTTPDARTIEASARSIPKSALSSPEPEAPSIETGPTAIWEPKLVTLPGGTFHMGSNDDPSERPIHTVTVKPLMLAKHATTVNEWQLCAEAKVCTSIPTGEPDEPVSNVSWDDVRQFMGWLSATTGQRYRLPTEAEWEYAARAGTETRYPWGTAMLPGKAGCKGYGNPVGVRSPPSVLAYPPNSFDLYGLGGGVAEWVADCWHHDYQGAPHDASRAWDASDCRQRVLRGGSWMNEPSYLRVSSREFYDASVRDPTHGFRIATSE